MVTVEESSTNEDVSLEDITVDLVCLIDCSGSMEGHKLREVQKTLIYMMELLSDKDRLSIVVFNSDSAVLNSFRRCTKENKSGKLLRNIKQFTANGGTNVVGGLKKAFKLLSKRKTKNQISSIFLLSDGNDNYDLKGLDELLDTFRDHTGDYVLNCFGFGDDHNPEMMIKLCQPTGGSFYYINDLDTVDEAFVDCIGLLKSSLGYKGQVSIELVPTEVFPEIRIS